MFEFVTHCKATVLGEGWCSWTAALERAVCRHTEYVEMTHGTKTYSNGTCDTEGESQITLVHVTSVNVYAYKCVLYLPAWISQQTTLSTHIHLKSVTGDHQSLEQKHAGTIANQTVSLHLPQTETTISGTSLSRLPVIFMQHFWLLSGLIQQKEIWLFQVKILQHLNGNCSQMITVCFHFRHANKILQR